MFRGALIAYERSRVQLTTNYITKIKKIYGMKGRKLTKLVALLSSGTFIMCDVFLVIISAKECQTDVLTKVGTILLCSFFFNGISNHRHFIFDFFFCTMYPCPDLLLEGVSKQ